MLQLPYIHTTLLIDELVKLEYEESGGKIRIKERAGSRKDRYSSLSYNYYVALQIESKLSRMGNVSDSTDFYVIRSPSKQHTYGKKVTGRDEEGKRRSGHGWL